MRETVLRQFFEGRATVGELTGDVAGAFDRRTDSAGTVFSQLQSTPMAADFRVESRHILKLVDALQAGELDLDGLDAICFCVEASDHFTWDTDTTDGERVAKALFWLGTPEINYPLTPSIVSKIQHYLLTGEETFTDADLRRADNRPNLLSVNRMDRGPDV
jgi:hypothetical protein